MGWPWAFERNAGGGRSKTNWTDNKHDSKGIGYFRKNHSLSCKNCAGCRLALQEKIDIRRRKRRQRKLEGKELLKILNYDIY